MGRKKGVVLSFALMAFEILSALLLTPFIIRSLGQAEYGVFKLVESVAAYLLLLDMGVGNAIVRYVAKYQATGERDKEAQFFGVAQLFYLAVGLVAALCGGVLVWQFPTVFASGLTPGEIRLGQILLGVVTFNAAFTLITAPYNYIIIGRGNFVVSRGASILQIAIRILLTFAALFLGFGSIGIVVVNTVTGMLCRLGLGAYVFVKLRLRPRLSGANRGFVKEIVGYSVWILLQMIATQVNAMAGQVMLGILVPGAAAVIAIYGVGTQISQYFQSFGSAFGGVLMPGVVNMVEQGATPRQLQDEMVRIGRIILLFLGMILGGFVLYGRQFVVLWAGGDYAQGYLVALLLMCVYVFILVESIGTQILWAKNEHKEQSILKIVIVGLNVLLTVFLIRWQPLMGVTVGTVLSLLLGDVLIMNIVFRRKIGICLTGYYKGLFRGIVPALGLSVLLCWPMRLLALPGWGGFVVNVAVYCVVCGGCCLLFGMNQSEKQMILKLLHKLGIGKR
ncbi:MAG: oligosaccharide flippase family protein [Oscillospiraceae bacterium]|nr:oligosaccharide flippase family protein [Oscillospiraceae bacterium]